MAKYMNLKINNSKDASIKSGKWKDPGASLYDQLLNAAYFPSDNVDDPKNENTWHYLREAYLIAPVKDIKYGPYGQTPYSRSGCKYPHHIIRNGELIVHQAGLRAAYTRAKQQGIFSGEVKEHLERHYKELGLYDQSTMKIDESMDHNFFDIESFIHESTGINLHSPVGLFESYSMKNLPDVMYFSGPRQLSELKGRVFLSPYAGISSIFIIDRASVMREYFRKYNDGKLNRFSYNTDYKEWGLPDNELTSPLNYVHITHNVPKFQEIGNGESSGYIYEIDISNMKDKLELFNLNPNSNREVIYNGSEPLKIIKVTPHTLKWEIKFGPENAKKHGNGIVESKDLYQEAVKCINDIDQFLFEKVKNSKEGLKMKNVDEDDLSWIEGYLMEDGDTTTPPENKEGTPPKPPEKKESMPQKAAKAEASANGVRRKNLYIAFINWAKGVNPKNTFGSIFDKDAFNTIYPFIDHEMRYFYRLANPMLCVLQGDLTFFAAAELRKLNNKNSRLSEMMIFAATGNDVRVFNKKDKKVYRGTEENGMLKLAEILGETFDTYIQKMINQGDILNAPITESVEEIPPMSDEGRM